MKKSIKTKVIKALEAAGYAPFIADWVREDGEPLMMNNETYSETVMSPYEPYSTDYETYDMCIHVDVAAIAKKHGCYWEPVNGAEIQLCEA